MDKYIIFALTVCTLSVLITFASASKKDILKYVKLDPEIIKGLPSCDSCQTKQERTQCLQDNKQLIKCKKIAKLLILADKKECLCQCLKHTDSVESCEPTESKYEKKSSVHDEDYSCESYEYEYVSHGTDHGHKDEDD